MQRRWHYVYWVDGIKSMGSASCNCDIGHDHEEDWYDD